MPGAYQDQRVEVGLALTQPPMQTRWRHAPGVIWLEHPERITGHNPLPNLDLSRDRLVGGAKPAGMGNADHPTSGDAARELDHSRTSRPHYRPRPRGEINAPVPR